MNNRKIFAVIVLVVLTASIAAAIFQALRPKESLIASVLYSCDGGMAITADYYQGASKPPAGPGQPPLPGGHASVSLSDGRNMTLQQTISADGIRYANPDESFVFWSKGNGALVLENGAEKSYTGCIAVAPEPASGDLSQIYSDSSASFSLRLPADFKAGESYQYQELGPGQDINGIKFTIPATLAAGTNLGSDSYLSVEQIPNATDCSANLFLDQGAPKAETVSDAGVDYSVAAETGAGAGQRYEEKVYAIPGTSSCMAVRYFIHYGVIDNYPSGAVKEFDNQALLDKFDSIRRTLTIK